MVVNAFPSNVNDMAALILWHQGKDVFLKISYRAEGSCIQSFVIFRILNLS